MDKTILHLLFNYKGKITAREFRVGSVVIFLTLGVYLNAMFNGLMTSTIIKYFGTGYYSEYSMSKMFLQSYIPYFVPTGFILAYSTFILAMKRIRSLTENCTATIISSVINYLFYASLTAFIMLLPTFTTFMYSLESKPYMIISISILLLIGLINFVILSLPGKSEYSKNPKNRRKLDPAGYALKLGNLIVIIPAIILPIYLIVAINKYVSYHWGFAFTYGISIIAILTYLFFYLKYAFYRLSDAGKSCLWIIGIFVTYVILTVLRVYLLRTSSDMFLAFDIFFSIVENIFMALQFVLFLLPSKGDNLTIDD